MAETFREEHPKNFFFLDNFFIIFFFELPKTLRHSRKKAKQNPNIQSENHSKIIEIPDGGKKLYSFSEKNKVATPPNLVSDP